MTEISIMVPCWKDRNISEQKLEQVMCEMVEMSWSTEEKVVSDS